MILSTLTTNPTLYKMGSAISQEEFLKFETIVLKRSDIVCIYRDGEKAVKIKVSDGYCHEFIADNEKHAGDLLRSFHRKLGGPLYVGNGRNDKLNKK